MREYVIRCLNFREHSAGIKCQFLLCQHLNRKGVKCYVDVQPPPHIPCPSVSNHERQEKIAQGAIAIYPDIFHGNPLGASRVVRLTMAKPGLRGGDKVYNEKDKVFVFSKMIDSFVQNEIAGHLFIPTFELDMWNTKDALPLEERTRECYYIGKGFFVDGSILLDGPLMTKITRQEPKREELPKIFKTHKVLHSYDPLTATMHEAVLCGCPVILWQSEGMHRDLFENSEMGLAGIAFGPNEYLRAAATLKDALPRYEAIVNNFELQLDRFIEITQDPSWEAY